MTKLSNQTSSSAVFKAVTGNVLSLVIAGGKGTRLHALTSWTSFDGHMFERAKPAVPCGAKSRIIDFLLSNLTHSGMEYVTVLLQYGAESLMGYLNNVWVAQFESLAYSHPNLSQEVPRYLGNADSVRQHLAYLSPVTKKRLNVVAIWAADHVTKFDVRPFLGAHLENRQARFTVAVMPLPIEVAHKFGVVQVDKGGKVIGFQEKPGSAGNPNVEPATIPDDPSMVLISLGNYLADREYLEDHLNVLSDLHDFGGEIIPKLLQEGTVYAFDMRNAVAPGEEEFYWRDVGTLGDFHLMHMEMLYPIPLLNAYNDQWPIFGRKDTLAGARFIGRENQVGSVLVAGGCRFEGVRMDDTHVGRNCVVMGASLEQSILFDGCVVGSGCRLRRVIVDEEVVIPSGTIIGYDHEYDKARGLYVDEESGIVIVPHGYVFN